ncbi:MAG TPA: pilin [Candidatus Paceibacterota bacterium]
MQKILEFFTKIVYADPPAGGGSKVFDNPLGSTSSFSALIEKVLEVLIQIGIPVLVVFIVYAGFLFVTAQGNEKKIEDAKSALFWAVIGGAVLVGAKVIATVVKQTVGVIGP